jgi:hypothetical protein
MLSNWTAKSIGKAILKVENLKSQTAYILAFL